LGGPDCPESNRGGVRVPVYVPVTGGMKRAVTAVAEVAHKPPTMVAVPVETLLVGGTGNRRVATEPENGAEVRVSMLGESIAPVKARSWRSETQRVFTTGRARKVPVT